MSSPALAFFCSLALLASTAAISGQEAFANPTDRGSNIELELLVVQIPTPAATAIVRELKNPNTRKAGIEKVHRAIDDGSAKIIGWPTVTTISRERAVVETITEHRFATAFQPGGVAINVNGQANIKPIQERVKGAEFNAIATAFETRNVGVTLEVEPDLDANGTTIHLQIVPQHVRLAGMKKVSVERENSQEKVVVEQPQFEVFKAVTNFAMESGDERLIGVFPTTEPAGHLELFLFRAEVRKP